MMASVDNIRTVPASRAMRLLDSRLCQFLLVLAFATLIRFPIWGEWNYDLDDQYYYLIGQRILHGAVLYVDVWDRKGPALYLFYAAVGAVSSSAIAYQIAATFCAACGGYGVVRLARLAALPAPALLAGLAYCALLNQFGGENGQAAVIFNPLIIACAWSIATRIDLLRLGRIDWALPFGMACTGIAIAFKQSVAIEAAFFELTIAISLWRSPMVRKRVFAVVAMLALIAALPMLVTFGFYAAHDHFAAMWQALVTSNLQRGYDTPLNRLWYLGVLLARLALALAFAIMGVLTLKREDSLSREVRFVLQWAIVALGAIAAFPAVYAHYALTALAPLCVLGAPLFARRPIGIVAWAALVFPALALGNTFHVAERLVSHRETPKFEAYVRVHTPHRRLLVWGVPNALYARLKSYPPSPVLFPPHYYEASENGATGHDPIIELQRILEWKPETVVVQYPLAIQSANHATIAMVHAYLRSCRNVRRFVLADHLGPQVQWVHTGCTG